MASLRSRLRQLFSTNIIITDTSKGLKVADPGQVQSAIRQGFVDRYTKLYSSMAGGTGKAQQLFMAAQRLALFKDYECISGDTIIPLPDGGNMTIRELSEKYPTKKDKFYVYSYDHNTDSVKLGLAHSVRKTKTEMTYKITFDDGKYLIATANHPFLMRNGEYKRVDELKVNDSVMPYCQKIDIFNWNQFKSYVQETLNHQIVSIEEHKILDVYDMTVEKYHNFATDSCFVHNSMEGDSIISSALDIYSDECLSSDTIVPLLDGRKVTIKELFDNQETNFWLYGINSEGNFTPAQAKKVVYKGKSQVYKITLEDGTILKSTGNHRWLNKEQKLIHTSNLKIGDGIYTLNTKFSDKKISSCNHRIVGIEKFNELEDVYDIVDVGDNHIYALEANDGSKIFTHNSTMKSDYGEVLTIYSEDDKIYDILYNLFYDVLNIEFNLWPWARNMPVKHDTLIPLLDGTEITIKELAHKMKTDDAEFWVYSVQDDTQDIVPGKVRWCNKTRKNAKMLKIWLDDNTFVETTPDHEFILRDGNQKQAKDLMPGDSLMPFYTKLSSAQESISGYEKIYNPRSNYYKFTHRIVSHNILRDKDTELLIEEPIHTHHCDFNKLNNTPDNLKRYPESIHMKLHGDLGARILRRKDVVQKRKEQCDIWLRSDEHKRQVSERQLGHYPPQFKQYNESELHTTHNILRKNSMMSAWKSGKIKSRDKLTFNNMCINYIIKYIQSLDRYIVLPELVDALRNDNTFLQLYEQSNNNNPYNISDTFSISTLRTILKRDFNLNYREFMTLCIPGIQTHPSQINKIQNHKVLKVEQVESSDAYCMEIVGPNGEHDRHNFAACSRGGDIRDGIFVSNCKYGDHYLYLNIMEKYGITNVIPISPYDIVRVEGEDPEDPTSVSFEIAGGDNRHTQRNYRQREFEEFEIAHFRLIGDSNLLPYGKSVVEGARKTWKQLQLMEDAMLIHRIMRAPERRVFKIDIGNIPPAEVEPYMKRIMDKMKKAPVLNDEGEYNLRYNMQNLLEDFYLPVRGSDSGTEIDTLSGLDYDSTDSIEYLKHKMMAALKIPKAFLGYEEGLGSKCLHPDTKIPLLSGKTLTIKEISNKFSDGDPNLWVYAYDKKTNSIIPSKVKIAEQTRKNAQLVRVHLDNNTYVDCTPDHNFVLTGGDEKQAQFLIEGESLQAVYRRHQKLASNANEYEQVYQPNAGKWQWTHKMVDAYMNGEIVNNGWANDRFDKNSLLVIHHSTLDRFNNHPDNLCRMRLDEHIKLQSNLRKPNKPWVEMSKNQVGLNAYNHKVTKVEWLSDRVDTYNLEVDNENHNYLIDNGIVIKNSTLAAEDVRFGRTIERIQRTLVSELTKIAIVHLMSQGFKEKDLLNFELKLTNPSSIYEQEQLEKWDSRVTLASNILNDGLMSSEWLYDNIFKFTEKDKEQIRLEILKDKKRKFRLQQIEDEGNDPVQSHEAVGTQGAMMQQSEDEGGSPPGGWEGAGRPEEIKHYTKDGSARGRDPLGAHDKKKGASSNPELGKSLALSHYSSLKNSKISGFSSKEKQILSETTDVAEEYLSEVSSSDEH